MKPTEMDTVERIGDMLALMTPDGEVMEPVQNVRAIGLAWCPRRWSLDGRWFSITVRDRGPRRDVGTRESPVPTSSACRDLAR